MNNDNPRVNNPFVALTNFPIAQQIGVAVVGAVLLIAMTSVAGWYSLEHVRDVQLDLLEEEFPRQEHARKISQLIANVDESIDLLQSSRDLESLSNMNALLGRQQNQLVQEIRRFRVLDPSETFKKLPISETEISSGVLAQIQESWITTQHEIGSLTVAIKQFHHVLDRALRIAIDDQLFYMLEGYRDLEDAQVALLDRATSDEILRLQHLTAMNAAVATIVHLSTSALLVDMYEELRVLRDQISVSLKQVRTSLVVLGEPNAMVDMVAQLEAAVFGAKGLLGLTEQRLRQEERQRYLVQTSHQQNEWLARNVATLVATSGKQTKDAALAVYEETALGKWIVLVTAVFSLAGAMAYSWFYVRKVLTRRLVGLAQTMNELAAGDLNREVAISGNDEVADMGRSLEIFRQHALEVQRLNLVETMALELEEKNRSLETTLDELRSAREKIILREKLASLGELTAGVAHEIKNPLNFIKNFSSLSDELVRELRTLVQDGSGDDVLLEIEEVSEMIGDNLAKIVAHGERADRIVNSMLSLGGDRQGTAEPINPVALVKEHANLAWHAVRAANPNYSGTLDFEIQDDTTFAVEVIQQELGRVILNLVTNACHACWERQQQDNEYQPIVTVGIDIDRKNARIAVRDNAFGVPEELVSKIFTPFFTTKETNVGTGLGLSMSYDIVKKYDGELSVHNDNGAVFVINLPSFKIVPALIDDLT